jgi:lysyl-tRNA synthetase class 1
MHWIDFVAETLLKRGGEHTIASGISISGHIHIGHANDVFIADAVRRSLEERGAKARSIWFADDYDPMRRIPWPLNRGELLRKYEEYLGVPYANIPSPDPEYENFVDYFSKPFIETLKDFGLKIEIYSAAEVYRSGEMANLIRTALERAAEIREILNRFREHPLPEGWLPFDPICQRCGRISTTRAVSWKDNKVQYRCEGTDYVEGCSHEGEADYTRGEGKLTWRVEWPARWKLLGVTCEPFGKDHAVSGGSYDTGKLISEEIFNYPPPYPVPYEWVGLKGVQLSSSKGVLFTLHQWLEIAEPELLRYFIFRSKPMKAKEFDPATLPDLYEEYDLAERVYFGQGKLPPSRVEQVKRVYELSQVHALPERPPQRVSFRFAAILCQVAKGERLVEILKARKVLVDPTALDLELALNRVKLAERWVNLHAPEHLKIQVLPEPPRVELSVKQREGLRRLAELISREELSPIELHNWIYEVAAQIELDPPKLFEAIYLALLGRTSGPRAGAFLTALDREFVVKMFREICELPVA